MWRENKEAMFTPTYVCSYPQRAFLLVQRRMKIFCMKIFCTSETISSGEHNIQLWKWDRHTNINLLLAIFINMIKGILVVVKTWYIFSPILTYTCIHWYNLMVILSERAVEVAVENEHEITLIFLSSTKMFNLHLCWYFMMTKALLKEKLHFHLLISSVKNRMPSNHMKHNFLWFVICFTEFLTEVVTWSLKYKWCNYIL